MSAEEAAQRILDHLKEQGYLPHVAAEPERPYAGLTEERR
jgi:hypothetical protein